MEKKHIFTRIAGSAARAVGHPAASIIAFSVVVIWAVSGPIFGFSDTWQLVINTGTTIVTFMMVFLIQNAQNRDAEAMQIKLDELIRVTKGAQTALLDLEELSEDELKLIQEKYEAIARQARKKMSGGIDDFIPSSKAAAGSKPRKARKTAAK